MNEKLLLVPSTHWDREWYKSQSEFSVYLIELFGIVLEKLKSGELGNYFTDGQTVMIEDIIKLKPEWQEKIAEFASQGKLELGPFYVLTDMYMPSGESFFRNISYGIEILRKLGGKPGIPYAPDAFGHNADLPAILNSAGFDAYFFCRGIGAQLEPPRSEFIWYDKYNSYKVLALSAIVDIFHPVTGEWISGAYGLGMDLPQNQDEFQERLEVIWNNVKKYSDLPVQLAMNGNDHLLPEENLAARLEKFNQANVGFTVETAPIAEYVREAWANLDIEKLPAFSGELIAGRFFRILTGTSSSRVTLKIRNAQSQFLLEKLVEPAMACAAPELYESYGVLLDNAWKWLLQNQAHDSICGCSIDAVHREMSVRFDKIESTMRAAAERLLRIRSNVSELKVIMPPKNADVLKVAVSHNAYELDKGKLWHFTLALPVDININDFILLDNNDKEYDFIAFKDAPASTTNGPFIPSGPMGRLCDRLTIYTNMPVCDGFGSTSMFFCRKNSVKAASVNNIPLQVRNGRLVLHTPEYTIDDFLSLIDTTDIGDEYDFKAGDNPGIFLNSEWREISSCVKGSIYTVEFAAEIEIPASFGSEQKVVNEVIVQIIGTFDDSGFAARFKIRNNACDHRLQLHIRTPFDFNTYCRQSQFGHAATPVERMIENDNWRDKTEPLRRNFGFISIADQERRFAILPQGLHEHTTDGSSFDITLLRAVGNLGKTGAGPSIITNEAQMSGIIECKIAFAWDGDGICSNSLQKMSSRFNDVNCGVILHPDIESARYDETLFKLDSDKLLISAFFYDKNAECTIVRIFNPASSTGNGILSGINIPAQLRIMSYAKGIIYDTGKRIDSLKITLNAGEIATFAV